MRPVTVPEAAPFFFRRGSAGALLLHGFTSTPFEVRELGERLAEAGITALGPVLPGHRTTPEDLAQTTWRDWFDATRDALAQLQAVAEPVFVMGVSLGGALALHLAAHFPEVAGVVAMSTPLRIRALKPHTLRLLARVRPYLPKPHGASIRDPEARARHPTYPVVPLRAVANVSEFLTHLWDDLPEVRAPALVIHAQHDRVASPADAPRLLECLGSSEKSLHWVANSDHIITEDFDKEEVFAKAVEFVRVQIRQQNG